MPDVSQQLVQPFFVQIHDGEGKAFVFEVHKIDEDEHYSGAVWCDDGNNALGYSEGSWNVARQIGRGDGSKGASWSPIDDSSS